MKFQTLKQLAITNGYTVGTFCTNGNNFYQDAVLYIAIGMPHNRFSPLVQAFWDVSYSLGRSENGNNKWARAIDVATQWIITTGAAVDTERILIERTKNLAKLRKNKLAKQRRASKKLALSKTKLELARLVPTTLRAVANLLDSRVVASFGINADEHAELLDETGLIAEYNGQLLVKQSTLRHGLGWYPLTPTNYPKPIITL